MRVAVQRVAPYAPPIPAVMTDTHIDRVLDWMADRLVRDDDVYIDHYDEPCREAILRLIRSVAEDEDAPDVTVTVVTSIPGLEVL